MQFTYILSQYALIAPRTVVHVGGHLMEEIVEYLKVGFEKIIFIEADPELVYRCKTAIDNQCIAPEVLDYISIEDTRERVVIVNALIADQDGDSYSFYHFSNDGGSSSIYKSTSLCRNIHGVSETGRVLELKSQRLDTVLDQLGVDESEVTAIVMDIQGAELKCLMGAGKYLKNVQFVECEVSTQPVYQGAPLFEHLEVFMRNSQFGRLTINVPEHGDCCYVNKRFYVQQRQPCG